MQLPADEHETDVKEPLKLLPRQLATAETSAATTGAQTPFVDVWVIGLFVPSNARNDPAAVQLPGEVHEIEVKES